MAIDKEREALVEMLNDMDGYPLTSSQKHALIAALTAQQEPVAMKYEIQRTAPKRIWLVMSDDPSSETDAFPKNYGEEITWCDEQVTQFDVPYVRADTAALAEKDSGGWMPIETAPRDGTWILAVNAETNPERQHVVHYSERHGTLYPWITDSAPMSFVAGITHWQPLPPLPERKV